MINETKQTAETTQPWVVYTYGLTHDLWWPFWNSTRVTGRAKIRMTCAICGERSVAKFKIPRFKQIVDQGHHALRVAFLAKHVHLDRPHPMSWALPLLNPSTHQNGLDLDLLAMRLNADIAASREADDE